MENMMAAFPGMEEHIRRQKELLADTIREYLTHMLGAPRLAAPYLPYEDDTGVVHFSGLNEYGRALLCTPYATMYVVYPVDDKVVTCLNCLAAWGSHLK